MIFLLRDLANGVPFITTYSLQHKNIKQMLSRHWHIVNNDRILKGIFPDRPHVVFRGAPSLRNRVSPNILDPPTRANIFSQLTGYYQCRRCRVCSLNSCTQTIDLCTIETLQILCFWALISVPIGEEALLWGKFPSWKCLGFLRPRLLYLMDLTLT